MYERYNQPPISRRKFVLRVASHFGVVILVVLVSLGVGIAGYMSLEGLPVEEAFLHAATLLGGMGLAETPAKAGAKLFAGLYALYSGLVFLAALGIVFAPVAHRLLHKFHWDGDGTDSD